MSETANYKCSTFKAITDKNDAVDYQNSQNKETNTVKNEKQVHFEQTKKRSSSTSPTQQHSQEPKTSQRQQGKGQSVKGKEKKAKKVKTPTHFDEDDEERERTKAEHYIRIYDDAKKAEKYYHSLYLEYKQVIVMEQREKIKKKTEQMERHMKERQEQEREEKLKQRKKMDRHNVSHDNTFLKKIPKSEYYRILLVQEKLQAEGKLKTRSDIEEFWTLIREPGGLKAYEPYSGSSTNVSGTGSGSHTEDSRSRTSSISSLNQAQEKPLDFRPLTGIDEAKEPSRPTTRENQAVMPQHQQKQTAPSTEPITRRDPNYVAKQAAIDLDKRFPQQNVPNLYCMDMEIGDKPPDREKILAEYEAERREKELKLFRKRLRKMHNLSQSHKASTRRILQKHESNEESLLESPRLGELMAVDYLLDSGPEKEDKTQIPSEGSWVKHLRMRRILPIWEEQESSEDGLSWPRSTRAESRSSASSGKISQTSTRSDDRRIILEPLTLNTAEQEGRVMEAKCLSTLWTNYTREVSQKAT